MPTPPRIRVVVQLPGNRPERPLPNLARVEWNNEKANVLWEVIALSRTSDNGGTDWKGLAAHLDVPLPYLLYRAQARYEEDLRGIKGMRGMLAPASPTQQPFGDAPPASRLPCAGVPPHSAAPAPTAPAADPADRTPPLSIRIPLKGHSGGAPSARTLSASGKLATPLGVRVRLNSFKSSSRLPSQQGQAPGQTQRHGKMSSSTATLQGTHPRRLGVPLRPSSPVSEGDSSGSSDASEVMRRKEEEQERTVEERETLETKLAELQNTMTSETVGLVRNPASPGKGNEKEVVRGRTPFPMSAVSRATAGISGVTAIGSPATRLGGEDQARFAPRTRNHSASISSTSSPQGSVPSIPSPTSPTSPRLIPRASSQIPSRQAYGQAPMAHGNVRAHLAPSSQPASLSSSSLTQHISIKSSSPPTASMRNARGRAHRPGKGYRYGVSEGESVQGSSASSFSDLSDASFSASALESAFMSNMPPGGSRLSTGARSKLGGRGVRQ